MLLDPRLDAVFDATWQAAQSRRFGGLVALEAAGAGDRVNGAHRVGDWSEKDIDAACAQLAEWGIAPLFRVDDADAGFIAALEARGFQRSPSALMMGIAPDRLTDRPIPPVTAFEHWPPLAVQRDMWVEGGFGSPRLAVMDRVEVVKTSLLGRIDDRAAATGFLALHDGIAMLHALVVAPEHRRKGMAGWMLRRAALWAQAQGADQLVLAVGVENHGAIATYDALGFARLADYSVMTLPG
ncbi:MAG: GNAT family N-acetyltransferase [Paracoccus sp. (in: a-proteobacteria)]|nr:GNAT family N-acetyltransferase [Paracoccus sp. (in: a-proteobacteria)]